MNALEEENFHFPSVFELKLRNEKRSSFSYFLDFGNLRLTIEKGYVELYDINTNCFQITI